MPLIQVTLAEGRSPEQLHALGTALTRAAEEALGAKRETVRVVITECEPEHWFVGGESLAQLRASGARGPAGPRGTPAPVEPALPRGVCGHQATGVAVGTVPAAAPAGRSPAGLDLQPRRARRALP